MKTWIFFILSLCVGFQNALANESVAREKYTAAKSAYEKGGLIKDYGAAIKQFSIAETLFKESFLEWRHPQTAYFIAIVNSELGDYSDVISFSQEAKSLHPPRINPKYLKSIDELFRYALEKNTLNQQARSGVMFMSMPIRIFPPQLTVPDNNI